MDCFKLFDISTSMWATYASMHMDGNAAKWLQMYKKFGLGNWATFVAAIEHKFGDHDYRTTLTQLLDLQQLDSTFEDLQYHITMHNSDLVSWEICFYHTFHRGP